MEPENHTRCNKQSDLFAGEDTESLTHFGQGGNSQYQRGHPHSVKSDRQGRSIGQFDQHCRPRNRESGD